MTIRSPCSLMNSPVQGCIGSACLNAEAERGVRRNIGNKALNQEQFDALVSLAYKAGVGGSLRTLKLVDTGEFAKAASNIGKMTSTTVNGKKVLARGLISRRAEESAPFRQLETAAVAKK